ncbi:unnamed protein product [Toxocara canis]|uniref:Transmembrane protein n=1 Tax=Toxocara canis TaxID=6265 RepID=A0A183UU10_TOXCA|nr:unnamed protein product [Toxocara canis]
MGQCVMALANVPAYMPQLIAFIIAFILFVGISIAYVIREFHRTKTFYGREDVDDMPEEEKMAQMGDLMGNNVDEMRIVRSAELLGGERESGSAATPSATGVKVMMRRRKHPNKNNSGELMESSMAPLGQMKVHFALDVDKTSRGFEFIDLLEKNKVKMQCYWFQSTTDKWIVHAVVQDRVWKVNGQENLLECGDVKAEQMLRLTASGPTTPITMMAYKVNT